MESSFWFDTINLGLVHYTYLGVSGYTFKKYCVLSPEDFYTFTNSVDTEEMQHYAAYRQGLHSLKKCLFRCFLNTKGAM